jgi:hypothetical protein
LLKVKSDPDAYAFRNADPDAKQIPVVAEPQHKLTINQGCEIGDQQEDFQLGVEPSHLPPGEEGQEYQPETDMNMEAVGNSTAILLADGHQHTIVKSDLKSGKEPRYKGSHP